MLSSIRGDKLELCLVVAKLKHIRSCESWIFCQEEQTSVIVSHRQMSFA